MPACPHPLRLACPLLACCLLAACATSTPVSPSPADNGAPAYAPRPVSVPAQAGYVLPDGRVHIIGNDGMQALIDALNAAFSRHHPNVRFAATLQGSSTGMPALAANATLLAPMTRNMWPGDRAAWRQLQRSQGAQGSQEPLAVRIGYSGYGPRPPHKTPPAVYVNASNPLAGLDMAQVARIFTDGQPGGDLNTWGQLGLTQPGWASRRIHAYGLRDDGGFATGVRTARLGGRPFSVKYEPLPSRQDVIRAVSQDPYGIGLIGWMNASAVAANVRPLPLAAQPGQPFYGPDLPSVRQGRYPLSHHVQFYARQPLDELARQYLLFALSSEGQAIVASQQGSAEGYVPLSADDLAAERRKLQAAP